MTLTRWRLMLWLAVLVALALLLHRVAEALVPFFVGGVIAYALLPIVDRVAAIIPVPNEVIRRGLAVLLVYLIFGGLFAIALALLVPVLSDQVGNFVSTLPERVDAAQAVANGWLE